MFHLRTVSQLVNTGGYVSDKTNLNENREVVPGPKIMVFQCMMLSGLGPPEIPAGGSMESLLKSRIRRRLQFVDYRDRGLT